METASAARQSELLPERRPVIKRHKYDGGRGEIYPYDEWADGEIRIATQGVDFATQPQGFYVTLYQWALRNGEVKFQGRVEGNKVIFKLGPLTAEQYENRRFYLTPEEYAVFKRERALRNR